MIVATLIAKPDQLTDSLVSLAVQATSPSQIGWLSAGEAVDLIIENTTIADVKLRLGASLDHVPVDYIVQRHEGRRKQFLLADMESTIIQQEMLEEMADAIQARPHVAEITRRAMNGELDFETALRERVALFAGQPASMLDNMARRISLMPGAGELVATMQGWGGACWLATGGFHVFVDTLLKKIPFDRVYANDLQVVAGHLTGALNGAIFDRCGKLEAFKTGLAELGLTVDQGITVGDGANDLPMLLTCAEGGGLGVAFRAKPSVAAAAHHCIRYGDLTALLFMQGISRAQFRENQL